jgi:photosystem II stability/assembly factor-like uncharacterized protein
MKKYPAIVLSGITFLVLLITTINAQWVKTNGPLGGNINALKLSGNSIFAGTSNGVFQSMDNGANWTETDSSLTNKDIHSIAVSGNAVFAGTWGGGVFLTIDNGSNWSAVNDGLPINSYVASLGVSNGAIFAGVWDYSRHDFRVFQSVNNGKDWSDADYGLVDMNVQCLAVCGSAIFAGTDNGGVFVSIDNGASWNADNSGLTSKNVVSLAVSGTIIFAGTLSGGVFLSASGLTGWTAVNSGLTNMYVQSLAVSGGSIFAGTDDGGVFFSTNNGASWTSFDPDFTNVTVHSLAISGSTVFAGTWGAGVWRRPLSEMTGTVSLKPRQGVSDQAHVSIRSPGRADHHVTVEFSLSNSDQVTARMYDPSGHAITPLVNRFMGPGAYNVSWDAGNMAAGRYMVRMKVGPNTFVKSVPILR